MSPAFFDRCFGGSPQDIDRVVDFAHLYDLTVLQTAVSKRSVILKGTVQKFSEAFPVFPASFTPESSVTFRGRMGSIHIPEI